MAHRPHQRANINPLAPRAIGACDRCGINYSLSELVWQYDYRGNDLVNIKLRVCTRTCVDKPYQGARPLKLPPDPLPVKDPRPLQQAGQEGTVSIIPGNGGPITRWDQGGFWDSGLTWGDGPPPPPTQQTWDSGLHWDSDLNWDSATPPTPPVTNWNQGGTWDEPNLLWGE